MKKIVIVCLVLVATIGSYVLISLARNSDSESQLQFSTLTRGDLENTISSTGTIETVSAVEIGTQVSGTIEELYVDYNDVVEKGQLLAVLDTTNLKAAIIEAEASVEQAKAQLDQAVAEYERNKPLYEKGYISEAEFLPYKTNLQSQQASIRSVNSKLERARQNLSYAIIRSPINGTVIGRDVEAGQTVAASLSAPVLFVIAEDLSKMEIEALVDESDIGQIKKGQEVRFTVLAYPDETFSGVVKQVRLQAETVQNVVNYTVVIDADNDEGLLLPGMTATVDFIIEKRSNVLMIASAALSFQPGDDMLKDMPDRPRPPGNGPPPQEQDFGKMPPDGRKMPPPDFAKDGNRPPPPGFSNGEGRPTGPPDFDDKTIGRLWYMDENGKLAMKHVKIGMTDGHQTEICSGEDISEGMQFIRSDGQITTKTTSSSNKRQGPPGPPGFF